MRFKILFFFLFIFLVGTQTSHSATYYLFNQWGGTWHDANKNYTDDSLMCWAASASNVLDWGKWDTASDYDERHIFGEFKERWTNGRGWMYWGWQWWLNGGTFNYGYAYVNVSGGGKYWPTYSFYNYFKSASGYSEISTMASLMNLGYGISYVVGPGTTNQHAITAWGYDYYYNNGKQINAIYYTDSDDKVVALKRMGISYVNGYWTISGPSMSGWHIQGVYGFLRRGGTTTKEITTYTGSGGPPAAAPLPGALVLVGSGLSLLLVMGWRRKV